MIIIILLLSVLSHYIIISATIIIAIVIIIEKLMPMAHAHAYGRGILLHQSGNLKSTTVTERAVERVTVL